MFVARIAEVLLRALANEPCLMSAAIFSALHAVAVAVSVSVVVVAVAAVLVVEVTAAATVAVDGN